MTRDAATTRQQGPSAACYPAASSAECQGIARPAVAPPRERRDYVHRWLTMTRQMREITGAAEFSALPLDEVERVRAAYGAVRVHAGNLFSRRETAGDVAR